MLTHIGSSLQLVNELIQKLVTLALLQLADLLLELLDVWYEGDGLVGDLEDLLDVGMGLVELFSVGVVLLEVDVLSQLFETLDELSESELGLGVVGLGEGLTFHELVSDLGEELSITETILRFGHCKTDTGICFL